MAHPSQKPTRPLSGLAATFKITRGTGAHIYNCRFCPARFEFPPISGGLRAMAPEERGLVYAHASTCNIGWG